MIADQFKSTISSAGFIILILGGYSAYMNKIKANNVTVSVLTKPIARIKSVYILVPIVFLLGNLLSLVVPSASNLAIILLATLYPILIQAGMSTLTAAGLIATTATIVPTPLGSDNVAIAAELAKTAEYADMSATDYVFRYHAMVSVPTLLLMAAVHYFWQKHCDKKGTDANTELEKTATIEEIPGGTLFRTVYAILPLLPILLLIGVFALQKLTGLSIDISVEVATLFSFVIAIICELIRTRSGTALFFAMVPLMVPLAAAAGIPVFAVSVPMGLAGNLLRAVSPVSAVVMIVAGSVKREPLAIVKRTAVPMIVGTVFMFVLSMILFL